MARFGGMIVEWNRCEDWARKVANCAAGETHYTFALTAALGGVQLANMLRILAQTTPAGEYRDHLEHVAEYFDRLRVHRNHFCHGVWGVMDPANPQDPENASGLINTIRVQGSTVKSEIRHFTERDLIEVVQWCELGQDYIRYVSLAFNSAGEARVGSETLAPVAKPPLPPQIDRGTIYRWFEKR
ncbi:MAG: hypothetical protein AB7P07_05735 [Hyphomonadaceae bacterium]